MPRANEMKGVCSAIRRGKWSSFRIKKWNDLIKYVFGEVKSVRYKYTGEKGLKTAIRKLKEFKKKHKRKPKYKDNEMNGITSAIQREE